MSMEKETENSGFLDGRDYTAAFLYKAIALLVGNGVYANDLAPTATNEDMSITHGSGHAWINGVCYENAGPFVLPIDTADGNLNRCDSLMVRLDLSRNETYAVIVKGDYAAEPTPPAVTRNAETWDLKICDIYIPAGCTKITQDLITDTRMDPSVCGVPVFPVEHLDMATFYRQISADLDKFKKQEQADFESWLESQKKDVLYLLAQMNDLVDGDTVGKLLLMINNALPTSGGAMTGTLSMGGNRVSEMADPSDMNDAANKGYVDSKRFTATATISTNWAGGSAPYTQAVPVAGVLATDMPHIAPVYSDTFETAIAQREAWLAVSDATSGAGQITFACFEDKPITAIPIQIEVQR